jgi:putative PEP-CTERM system TPR-repeat lipoprotein
MGSRGIMAKRVDIKRLVRTVFYFCLLLFVMGQVVGLQGCSKHEMSDVEYVAKAKDYHDKGKLKAAVIEAKNALRVNPDNAEARWLLGSVYLEVGNGLAAEKELNRARDLGVSSEAVVPMLLQALLQQANYSGVLGQDISEVRSKDAVAEIHASRGVAYLFLKRMGEAKAELDKAIALKPDSLSALVGMARMTLVKGDYDLARQYIEKALSFNDHYAPAWSVKGDLLQVGRDADGAIAAYSKAIENRYNNGSDLLKRILLYIEHERYADAQHDLDQLIKRFPKHPGVTYAQGVLYFAQKKYQQAAQYFERTLDVNKDELRAVYYLGATQYLLGNHEQAKSYLSRYLAAEPRHINTRKILALISLEDGEYDTVKDLIRPVVKGVPDDAFSMNILANALLRTGETEEALQLLKKVVELEPKSAKAYTQLSLGLISQGDVESGRKALATAIELDPQFQQADVMLVMSYLREEDYVKAQKAAEAFIDRQPKNVVAYNMLASVLLSRKQEEQAEKTLKKALSVAPGDPVASDSLAALALKKGNTDEAKQYYGEALKAHPGHLVTMMKLAELQSRLGEQEAMIETLNEAIKQNPDAAEPRVVLAREYLRQGKTEQASVLFTDIPESRKDNPYVLGMLGEVQLASHDYVNAKITLKRLVELYPNESQSHFLLAKAYKGLNESQLYKTELERAVSIKPEHVPARIALGQFWVTNGNVAKAKEYLSSLQKDKRLEGSPELLKLEGDIFAASNDAKQALSVYKDLFKTYPSSASLLTLSTFQWSQGDKASSTRNLEKWLEDHSDDVKVRLSLANNYLGLGQVDDATQQYRKVLKLSENSLVAMNNLAWYLRESNPKEALAIAEKASEYAPDSALIMDTMAVILMEKGDFSRAERFINRALDKFPTDPTLLYHRILIHEKTSAADVVTKELKQLLEKYDNFPERKEAESLLQKYESTRPG